MGLKRCKGCEELKPLSEFFKKSTARDGRHGRCKACWNIQVQEYRRRSPKKVQAWTQANRHTRQAWYWANRAEILEKQRLHRLANLDKYREKDRRYREKNHDIIAAATARRRAYEADAEGQCTSEQWEALKVFYCPTGKCLACGEVKGLTVDHVIPLSLEGSNWPANLQPLCLPCNLTKHTKAIDYRPDKGGVRKVFIEQKSI